MRYDNPSLSHPGGYVAADPYVGEPVTRRGSTTGTHSGTVEALNVTVNYSSGETVHGLFQTDVCAEGGNSGGALYNGNRPSASPPAASATAASAARRSASR